MLTPKQVKFVQGIIEGMSQAEAYRSAYSCKNMSDNAIYREASVLLKDPKISQRVSELREQLMKEKIMSAQERLELLTRIAKGEEPDKVMRFVNGEWSVLEVPTSLKARQNAIDLMNKMTGEYTQKVEADVNGTVNINIELSDD